MKKTTSDVLQDGLLSGFIGYGLISLYFTLLNLLAGKPAWLTAQTFGDALFPGSFPGPMIAFNGTHLAIYLSDPDSNDLELAWDRPFDEWPRDEHGRVAMAMDDAFDIEALVGQ